MCVEAKKHEKVEKSVTVPDYACELPSGHVDAPYYIPFMRESQK